MSLEGVLRLQAHIDQILLFFDLNGYGFKLVDTASYIYFPNEQRIVIVGTPKKFMPTVQNLDNVTFTWASSDETVATVAADGTVTGKAAGTVTITATTDADEGWTASYELTVSEPNYAPG